MNLQKFLAANQLPGEIYAGLVLGQNGEQCYHLFLRPEKPAQPLSWPDAMAWAKSIGYELPTRRELSLLFANCRTELEIAWLWSGEQITQGDYAWVQGFLDGSQFYSYTSDHDFARAVRRVYLQEAA